MSSNYLCNVGKLLGLSELQLVHKAGQLSRGPLRSLPVSAFCVNTEALVFSPIYSQGSPKDVPHILVGLLSVSAGLMISSPSCCGSALSCPHSYCLMVFPELQVLWGLKSIYLSSPLWPWGYSCPHGAKALLGLVHSSEVSPL